MVEVKEEKGSGITFSIHPPPLSLSGHQPLPADVNLRTQQKNGGETEEGGGVLLTRLTRHKLGG